MNRRHTLPLFLLAAAAAVATSAFTPPAQADTLLRGSGRVVEQARSPGEFRALHVSGPLDVVATPGDVPAVRVSIDDNLQQAVETVVDARDGQPTLHVRLRDGVRIDASRQARVVVVAPRLHAVALAGSGDLVLRGFRQDAMAAALAGSGDLRLDEMTLGSLIVDLAGSGDVEGSGSADKLVVSVAGSGDVDLSALRSADVTVGLRGSGDVAVQARRNLTVSIAGSGDVRYVGEPRVVSSIAGSGSVARR